MASLLQTFVKSKPLPKATAYLGVFNAKDNASSTQPTTMTTVEIVNLIDAQIVGGSKTFLDKFTVDDDQQIVGNLGVTGNINDCPAQKLDNIATTRSDVQDQIDSKADAYNAAFQGTTTGITKAMVGLGSVDNTSDSAKPISSATQTALNLKANANAPTFTGTAIFAGLTTTSITDSGNVTIKGNTILGDAVTDSVVVNCPTTFNSTVTGITKAMVGLGSVDNTADSAKPVSTAQQTALNLKADTSAMTTALALKADLASPQFTGTATFEGLTTTSITDSGNVTILGNTILGDAVSDSVTINCPLVVNSSVTGLTKSMVSLGSVDNTSDSAKPVSTAQQTALNLKADTSAVTTALALKADLASPTFTGVATAPTASLGTSTGQLATCNFVSAAISDLVGMSIPSLNTLSEIGNALNNDPSFANSVATSLTLKAPLANPTFTGTVSGVSKTMVGLGNCDNTSDANKPVSTAQQTALNLKADKASPVFTGTATFAGLTTTSITDSGNVTILGNTILGDTVADSVTINCPLTITSTVTGLSKSMVGLGNCDNTSDSSKPVSTAQQTALNLKADLASPTFTGTVSGVTKAMVGLGNCDNTSDANKPVSTAQQTALNLKADLASPTFTGTVSGVTKAMVGLGNCDNTSDSAKPISTATQTALDLKATIADPAFTGVPTAPTASLSTSTTQIATTSFVKQQAYATLDSPALTGTPSTTTASAGTNTTRIASTQFVQTALADYAPLAAPTFTGSATAAALEVTGMMTAARICERVTSATIASNNVNINYSNDAITYCSGLSANTNFSVTLTGINPIPLTNRVFTITLAIDTSTYKAYANTVTVNGTSRTIKWPFATAPDVSSATTTGTIFQTISVFYNSSSSSVPYIVTSIVNPFG